MESLEACFMTQTTIIDSEELVVSPADSSVEALDFYSNKNIKFLPIRVDESFPNLVGYAAESCSLKTVSNKNFRNLNKLRALVLRNNEIERINSDTFESLTSLEVLFIDQNKITEINGAAFRGLNGLTNVYLGSNFCIDREYTTPTAIASLTREVNENCGFTEILAEF